MIKRIITFRELAALAKKRKRGFSLVELLSVLAVASLLAVLSVPAIQGLNQASGFDKSVYAFADSLNFARSYAMANNTYVYMGLTEVNRAQSTLASPQTPGVGRVVLSIVATTDGTSDTGSFNSKGNNLTQVRQPQLFDFFHICYVNSTTGFLKSGTGTGTMLLPSNIVSTSVTPLPLSSTTTFTTTTPFSLPLGSTTGTGKYNFVSSSTSTGIICFNPQGEVLLNGTAVQWLEIDLQPTVGTATPAAPSNVNQGNIAALVIDGVTGSVTVHRP
jgi:prepilin-type N-terminal cleavage/methylation domain-containing protein